MDDPKTMDAARFRLVAAAFEEASALTGTAREQWLAERQATDPDVASEVRALLAAQAKTGVLDRRLPGMPALPEMLARDGASSTESDKPLPLPAQVGPYVVAGQIGRGGVGIVCRAHDPRLGRDVALKVFPHALTGGTTSETERRVLAEARAASALDHPHICTIYDVGALPDGRPYLAMAYYPGGTLADRLIAGPLPLRDATTIALQIADALACAHAAGIVHRDVKPHNVAFGERGESKLLDFGIALLRDRTGEREHAGTPAYMAPEQVRCDPVDGRSDVWALGVVLFEMVTGRRPFTAADRGALLHAIVHYEPADVRALRADVPPAVAALVSRALRKAPGERPTAADMASTLRDVLVGLDGSETRGSRPRAPQRRRRTAIAVGAVGALVAATLWMRARPASDTRATAVGAAALGAGAPATTPVSVAVLPFVALGLEGRDSGSTYLADGITEDVLTELARVPDLHVRSRESVERYRDSAVNTRAVAGALDVRYLLRGTVRRSGDQLRITARLTDVAGDRQMWAESYDRPLADVLAVQREIAAEIARALGASVGASTRTMPPLASVDPSVYDLFLRARARYHTLEPQAPEQAVALLQTVLAQAPDFSQAHALLARTYVRSVQLGWSRQGQAEWLDSAVVEAKQAITLAPAEPAGYAALGAAYAARGRHADAVAQYRRALDLDPRHPQAMMDLSRSYMALDRFEEGFVWMERALALDPTLPDARSLAVGRYLAWDIPEHARRHLDAGLRLDPSDTDLQLQEVLFDLWNEDTASATRRFAAVLPLLGPEERTRMSAWFAMQRGDFTTARRHADRLLAGNVRANDPVGFGAIFQRTGARAVGDSIIRHWLEVQRTDDRLAGSRSSRMAAVIAYTYASLGERDPALRELARFDSLDGLASRKRVAREPGWGSLRDDPRFIEFVARADARFYASRARILARLAEEGLAAPATVRVR